MADLQSFMSDLLIQCNASSIVVASDNARIPRQQQATPSEDYKATTRWESVEAIPPALGPPVRKTSNGDTCYSARGSPFSPRSRKTSPPADSSGLNIPSTILSSSSKRKNNQSLPKMPIRQELHGGYRKLNFLHKHL